ncbi:putative pectinacetylesterase/NOTUM [Helianthus annuus]|nr:putative pectinacetylesterase/NOTUM [Helianthus annuus]
MSVVAMEFVAMERSFKIDELKFYLIYLIRGCFFPENVVQEIETPLFVTNAAYDSGQNAVAPAVVNPHGKWHDCKMDIEQCSSDQIEIIQGH